MVSLQISMHRNTWNFIQFFNRTASALSSCPCRRCVPSLGSFLQPFSHRAPTGPHLSSTEDSTSGRSIPGEVSQCKQRVRITSLACWPHLFRGKTEHRLCLWSDILQATISQSIMIFFYFSFLSGPGDIEHMTKINENLVFTTVQNSRGNPTGL